MNHLKNIVTLMHDCFEADKRQQSFWNVFSKNYQHLHFFDDENLWLSDHRPAISDKYATAVNKTLTTYKREKELLFSTFLLVGNLSNSSISKKVYAPLACYNATVFSEIVSKKQFNKMAIERSQPTINIEVLQQIIEEDISDFPADIFCGDFTTNDIENLKAWFNKYCDIFDTSLLDISAFENFPTLCSKANIDKLMEEKSNKIFVVPAAASLVVRKSFLSRGVLYELEQIANNNDLLNSLNSFFQPSKAFFADEDIAPIPATLSDSQKRIIRNSKNYSLSTVIGPPGTGKSYTISALALEYFMNQKSVLIVSNTEQSISVIEQKLIEQFSLNPEAIIRCGDGSHHKKLKAHIEAILKTIDWDLSDPQKGVDKTAAIIKKLEKDFAQKCQKYFGHSKLLFGSENGNIGLFDKIRLALFNRSYNKSSSLKSDLDQILKQRKKLEEACIKFINFKWQQRTAKAVEKRRKHLSNFLVAIKARSSSKQEKFFAETNFDVLLDVMPIWLVSLSNIHRALPLKEDLFDLVIFDEATQCNIASALPALVRAKSAVVVGDPKQLRHFSFLSNEVQSHIFQQYPFSGIPAELNYRDDSILDATQQLISDNDAISYLDEHFRSHPQIIGYSNRNFYDSKLKIMTQKPQAEMTKAIEIDFDPSGTLKKGVNKIEAERLLKKLSQIISSQKGGNLKSSIGILALFSNQADFLESKIMKMLTEEQLAAHKIRVGTAYSFQGEERDIMLISCCVDNNCNASNYQYINRDDSFNVGITRARDKQILFTSADKQRLLQGSHLANYINYCNETSEFNYKSDYVDHFQQDLCKELKRYSVDIKLQFEVAGIPVDIIAIHNGKMLGIDLIGFPGEMEDFISLQSFKLLGRANLQVIPISYNEWLLDRKGVLDEILSLLSCSQEELAVSPYKGFDKVIHFTYLEQKQRKISFTLEELSLLQLTTEYDFLNYLQKSYCNLITVANNELQPESISFQRFRGLAISIFEQCLENLDAIINSHKQINLLQDSSVDGSNNSIIEEESELSKKLNDENSILLSKMNQLAAELGKQNLSDNNFELLAEEIDRHIEIAAEFKDL